MATAYAAPAFPGLARRERPESEARTVRRTRPAAGMRITRRGRLAILMLALGIVLLPGAWRAMATAQTDGMQTATVTVQAGDTLWAIASAVDPGADPRVLIAEIREINSLSQSGLVPGQILVVPSG